MVEVLLWHGSQRVRLLALVDSGADSSLIDVSYAEVLGLDMNRAQQVDAITAAGTPMTCFTWPGRQLELQFEDRRFPFEGSFAQFPPDSDGMNLLGRKDFFKEYIIQFWDAAELMNIDVSPDHPRPGAP